MDNLNNNSQETSNVIQFPGNLPGKLTSAEPTPVVPTPAYDKLAEEAVYLDEVSRYKSSFDYNTFKNLELRYKDKPIHGGVVMKTVFRLANFHTTCQQCLYSFEIDTYGRGCIHDCAYCYAKAELTVHGMWNNPIPVPANLNEIRKAFYTAFETEKRSVASAASAGPRRCWPRRLTRRKRRRSSLTRGARAARRRAGARDLMQIGDLARETGKTVRAIHLYEELGLLTPAAARRAVPPLRSRRARRIRWIGKLQEMGFSLSDIQTDRARVGARRERPRRHEAHAGGLRAQARRNARAEAAARSARARARGEPPLPRHLRRLRPAAPPQRLRRCDLHDKEVDVPELVLGFRAARPTRQVEPAK